MDRCAIVNQFLPALPARGATALQRTGGAVEVFLPALPARGATQDSPPRENPEHFYPRSPRGERLAAKRARKRTTSYFYPRSPRGERRYRRQAAAERQYFYPRSPRGERQQPQSVSEVHKFISTRAPREGSDIRTRHACVGNAQFLPALPARGATSGQFAFAWEKGNFYPRSPRGERHNRRLWCVLSARFLPALPARGATGTSHHPFCQ